MISIYFFGRSKKDGSIIFVRELVFETIREKNEALRHSGAAPGQWLNLPGEKVQIAWLPTN